MIIRLHGYREHNPTSCRWAHGTSLSDAASILDNGPLGSIMPLGGGRTAAGSYGSALMFGTHPSYLVDSRREGVLAASLFASGHSLGGHNLGVIIGYRPKVTRSGAQLPTQEVAILSNDPSVWLGCSDTVAVTRRMGPLRDPGACCGLAAGVANVARSE